MSSEVRDKRHRSTAARLLPCMTGVCMTGVCMTSVRGIPASGCFTPIGNRIGVTPGVAIVIAVGVPTCCPGPGVLETKESPVRTLQLSTSLLSDSPRFCACGRSQQRGFKRVHPISGEAHTTRTTRHVDRH